ncbi:PAAR domain-containing protein [Burkholderia metallica]|uniref:PAAR domain-containing protein n=1 Tax=Burkholderia metallica TaxID=488729 RepID=UPI001CF55CEC|nr:PAAR domain-containing protein [Burkholderia metallica]MCA8018593.1 PAAR domain-containing protein [Burkholderia metallica]
MARAMICVGDTTTHGGRVLEGSATATIDGKPIAGVGHKVLCPQCKGVFPILPTGRQYSHTFDGRETAVEGMKTACGATLIASQSSATFDDVGSGEATTGGASAAVAATAAALAPSPTLCLECLTAAAENAATMIARG